MYNKHFIHKKMIQIMGCLHQTAISIKYFLVLVYFLIFSSCVLFYFKTLEEGIHPQCIKRRNVVQ